MAEEIACENGQISNSEGLDLDLGSCHTECRRASLIDCYLHAKFHWNWRNFLSMDGRTYAHTYIWIGGRTFDIIFTRSTLSKSQPNNTVTTISNSTYFHLLQTSLSVPTLETTLDTTDRLRLRPLLMCF